MDEQKIQETIEQLSKNLPRFPDGRINYRDAPVAPVITIFVQWKNEILLLKRSDKVRTYKGKWNAVAGYLDEIKPLKEKILEELREEIGLEEKNTQSMHFGKPYRFTDASIQKTWIIHPVVVELKKKPMLQLDWEHTEYQWIQPKNMKMLDSVPMLEESWKHAQE